ncbi:hypothetical protein PROFUN_14593 [Planoprotostelium fungivorum]|uniref:Uncharacterized protein n=1 Tax=Planoprotostelium fungivorum TaxID=1890364 RepID=A0A2P6MZF1_9EUKA|nr:hypothetical protein PROFUN_14593 [Planoprotostelium fungivorum]
MAFDSWHSTITDSQASDGEDVRSFGVINKFPLPDWCTIPEVTGKSFNNLFSEAAEKERRRRGDRKRREMVSSVRNRICTDHEELSRQVEDLTGQIEEERLKWYNLNSYIHEIQIEISMSEIEDVDSLSRQNQTMRACYPKPNGAADAVRNNITAFKVTDYQLSTRCRMPQTFIPWWPLQGGGPRTDRVDPTRQYNRAMATVDPSAENNKAIWRLSRKRFNEIVRLLNDARVDLHQSEGEETCSSFSWSSRLPCGWSKMNYEAIRRASGGGHIGVVELLAAFLKSIGDLPCRRGFLKRRLAALGGETGNSRENIVRGVRAMGMTYNSKPEHGDTTSWIQQIINNRQPGVSSDYREALHEAVHECRPTPIQAVPCFHASRCAMSSLMQLCGYESANKNTSTKHEEYMEWLRKEGILIESLIQTEKPVVVTEKAASASSYTMIGILLDKCEALLLTCLFSDTRMCLRKVQ